MYTHTIISNIAKGIKILRSNSQLSTCGVHTQSVCLSVEASFTVAHCLSAGQWGWSRALRAMTQY